MTGREIQLDFGARAIHIRYFIKTMSHRPTGFLPEQERACLLENQETGSEKSLAQGRRVALISLCEKAGTQAQDSKSSCSFTKWTSKDPQLAHRETSHWASSISEDHRP